MNERIILDQVGMDFGGQLSRSTSDLSPQIQYVLQAW